MIVEIFETTPAKRLQLIKVSFCQKYKTTYQFGLMRPATIDDIVDVYAGSANGKLATCANAIEYIEEAH